MAVEKMHIIKKKPNGEYYEDFIIELKNVYVSYHEDVALHGASLNIKKGEFMGVIGPNGAGKTTLLTVVNGLAKIHRGTVRIFGKKLDRKTVREIRKQVGYVPQHIKIDPRTPLSAREAVMIGRCGKIGLLTKPCKEDYEIVDDAIELVGMSEYAERSIGTLSGGQQQRITIARALAQKPKILLLDEPTSAIDLPSQKNILDLVRRIHTSEKLTTLFVTHNMSIAPQYCDRVVLMNEGKICALGPVEEILTEKNLTEIYRSQISIFQHDSSLIITST